MITFQEWWGDRGQLIFSLIQNWQRKYPEQEPYSVIKYVGKAEDYFTGEKKLIEGYSACDEYGNADWLPGGELFLPANEETQMAFLGETKVIDEKLFLVIKNDYKKKEI